ncbi:MAG: hypothetical protein KF745_13525 [Phycisphaeraceae bacterium]|nr:hypothetical protein [Phycisphaeraceae bacterium]
MAPPTTARQSPTAHPAAEQQYTHVGETKGCEDHDRDLIHFLSHRLDFLWRCDQYIANAEADPDLQTFWRDVKRQETENVKRAREIVTAHVRKNCF